MVLLGILTIASTLLLLTTLAPHFPGKHWIIRDWEFPRVQQIVLIIFCLVGWGWINTSEPVLSAAFLALLVFALLYQIRWVLPYTPLVRKEVPSSSPDEKGPHISILTSNVYMYNENSNGLVSLVNKYKPDMLVTLETNKWWQEALAGLHEEYPHRLEQPLDNLYGMHLYSRIPFEESEIRFLIEDDVPSFHVRVKLDETPVTLYFLHPKPPSPTENETAQPRDAELAMVGREMASKSEPVIVAGDLNDVAWSPTTRKFRKLSGALDPRIGRGFYNTFHANYRLIRWPLDHVFHSKHFTLRKIIRLESFGSDHFPLYTELQLNQESQRQHASSPARKTEKS